MYRLLLLCILAVSSLTAVAQQGNSSPADAARARQLYEQALPLLQAYDSKGALPLLQEAIRLDPTTAEYHYGLGIAYQRRADFKSSFAPLREAVRLAPGNLEYVKELGVALRFDHPQEAIPLLEVIAAANSGNPEAQMHVAQALSAAGRHEEALRQGAKALALAPQRQFLITEMRAITERANAAGLRVSAQAVPAPPSQTAPGPASQPAQVPPSQVAPLSHRAQLLKDSLAVKELVPGVHRGWEGDPRTPTWVNRCDDGSPYACWLVGIQLTPMVTSGKIFGRTRWHSGKMVDAPQVYGLHYLERGCGLSSAEACADLGDFYRFNNRNTDEPWPTFDLKRAYTYYKRACDLSSAYGCYVLAELTDRGIGAPRDTGRARSVFAELCDIGVAVACLRLKAPAAAYPYKVFSGTDSTCSGDAECWIECQEGTWAACGKIDWKRWYTIVPAKDISPVAQRACRDGSSWGCKQAYAGRPQKEALVQGCEAGSEWACREACWTFAKVMALPSDRGAAEKRLNEQLVCETRFRTYAGVKFVNDSIDLQMRDCFGGGDRGCWEFLRTDAGRLDLRMTPEESNAYRASAYFFNRMKCNAGQGCTELQGYYGASQLGWAYRISDHVTLPATHPFFQSLTPLERVMASGWLMFGSVSDVPHSPDVVIDLDAMCNRTIPIARACRVLGEYFDRKSVTVSIDPQRQESLQRITNQLKELDAGYESRQHNCYGLPGGGTATVVVTPEITRCQKEVSESYAKSRAELFRAFDFWQSYNSGTYNVNPELKSMASSYWIKACKAGDTLACSN